ncbi:MAG: integrase [Gammaproteobacteria bacterium]|nr:integrase [Gammaproteobacteria bacterium]MYF31383.1 integrase [Gammaproteobacteria bacterium]MYK45576.1 integrase [Gammaproteobacteria bacterium]
MRPLNWDLKLLEREAKDGSRGKRRDRSYSLALMANTLHDLGFKGLRARGLKEKHVDALVGEWNRQGLSTGTMANRMAHVRWWAQKVGRPGVVRPSNAAYGIVKDSPVAREDKSRPLDPDKLAKVTDPHVRMSLLLQDQFGLRREEAMKFQPRYADRGDRIVLKASWCKGGRTRWIPVLTDRQRKVLDEARRLVGSGSLIPADRSYRRQLRIYEREVATAGMARMHGLRHGYAIRRYEHLTGWKAPVRGGPSRRDLDDGHRDADRRARLMISRELGHGRESVTAQYVG